MAEQACIVNGKSELKYSKFRKENIVNSIRMWYSISRKRGTAWPITRLEPA